MRPLSLYVHVPFCANICYYCACNKVITKDRARAAPYLQRLEQEIQLIACTWARSSVLNSCILAAARRRSSAMWNCAN